MNFLNKILYYCTFLLIIACGTSKRSGAYLLSNNKNVEIEKVLCINEGDSIYLNELKLHSSNSFYTGKYMYKKFGHWNRAIKPNEGRSYYLVWENCKLFKDKDELFNVAASGIESMGETYSSVIVYNNKNFDLLSEKSSLRDTLVRVFYYGAKKTNLGYGPFFRDYATMRETIDK